MQDSIHQLEHKDGTLEKGRKKMAAVGFSKSEREQEDGALQPPILVIVSEAPNQCLKLGNESYLHTVWELFEGHDGG